MRDDVGIAPYELRRAFYEFAVDFIKSWVPAATPQPLRRQLPFQGFQVSCCPLWGKCRVSGKGGVVGNFELLPFNGQHPLSQPVRAASSPIGEPRREKSRKKGVASWGGMC